MEDTEQLSKKERIRLRHETEKEMMDRLERKRKMMKFIWIGLAVVFLAAAIFGIYKAANVPKPGEAQKDEGRDHVEVGKKVNYLTNPPNSGAHYEEWEKAGVYDKPLPDERLVHSLEHGYVIISYNCDAKKSALRRYLIPAANAQTPASGSAESAESSPSADISGWTTDSSCQAMVKDLKDFAEKIRLWKLIVIPRPGMETKIALTAWTRLERLDGFDEKRFTAFIDAFRDKGPEATME